MSEVIATSTPVARKQHTCDVCRTPIEPGTRYARALVRMDDVYTWREHEDCGRVGSATLEGYFAYDDGYTDESVEEWLHENRDHLTDEQATVLARIEKRRADAEAANVR